MIYMLETQEQPQDAQEQQKRLQGPGPMGRTGPESRTQAPAASFVVPEHREAVQRLKHMNYGSEAADLEKVHVVASRNKIM